MTGTSLRSAVALRSPLCGSGLAATLPRLCRPGPALAEPLCPYPLRLRNRHHQGAPHPDVHLVGERCCRCPGPPVCRQRSVQYADRPWSGMGQWGDCCRRWSTEWGGRRWPQHVGHRSHNLFMISYMISQILWYHTWYHMFLCQYHIWYHVWYHEEAYDIRYDIILTSFLRYSDIVKKRYDIIYDIIA